MDGACIQTARLLLRPFELSDAADVFAYASNPNVSRFTTFTSPRALADTEAFIARVLARADVEHTWAIRLLYDTRVVGAIEFAPSSETEAEFHYVLAEEHWNRGLMTEAARAVLVWGRTRYPSLRCIRSRAMSENVASQRVMEKCGLRFDRVRMVEVQKFGGPVEYREYSMLIGGAEGEANLGLAHDSVSVSVHDHVNVYDHGSF